MRTEGCESLSAHGAPGDPWKEPIVDASVIIPTHNRCDWVIRAVRALVRQTHPAGLYEIIVACDRCTDGTSEALAAAFGEKVRVVQSDAPGQAGALNTGLKHALGELAILLDDEMEAEPGFVAAHVSAHRVRPGARLAVTGYSPVLVDSATPPYVQMMARNYRSYFERLAQPDRVSSPVDLCGCNFSLPLSAFREVSGFNESYFFQRNDFELAVRLLPLGYEIAFCREAQANQHIAVSAAAVIDRTADRARNDCRLAREYPWCIPHLPFFRVLTEPAVRRRWRVLWETASIAAGVIQTARRVFPGSLRLANLEYAARYCMGLRKEIGSWRAFRRLAETS
jgi:GT2 family glycosyltransferase